jgi:hypothetical protein
MMESKGDTASIGKIVMIAGEAEKLDFDIYKKMDDAMLS